MTDNPYSSPMASVDTRPRTRRSKETGKENYNKAARAHFALGCFAVLMVLISVGLWTGAPQRDGMEFFPYVVTGIFAFITALHFLVWWGAKRRAGWARITSLCIGLLSLTGFPIGTIIGIYLIVQAWGKWVEPEYYEPISLEGWPGQPAG